MFLFRKITMLALHHELNLFSCILNKMTEKNRVNNSNHSLVTQEPI